VKGAGKIPPFSIFITIYSMKLVIKEKIDFHPPSKQSANTEYPSQTRYSNMGMEEECGCTCPKCHQPIEPDGDGEIEGDEIELIPQVLAGLLTGKTKIVVVEKKQKKKKRDRCTTMAASKFDPFPSYNAAAAISRCRKGEIWKKKK
jgi:hypothetical protein